MKPRSAFTFAVHSPHSSSGRECRVIERPHSVFRGKSAAMMDALAKLCHSHSPPFSKREV